MIFLEELFRSSIGLGRQRCHLSLYARDLIEPLYRICARRIHALLHNLFHENLACLHLTQLETLLLYFHLGAHYSKALALHGILYLLVGSRHLKS